MPAVDIILKQCMERDINGKRKYLLTLKPGMEKFCLYNFYESVISAYNFKSFYIHNPNSLLLS